MPDRAGVLDLRVELPEVLCVDTSALICALFDDQPHHGDYLAFFSRIAEAGTMIVYSEILDLELAQMCIKTARRRSDGRRTESIHLADELLRSTFARWREIFAKTESVRATLAGNDNPSLVGSPIRAAAFYLMHNYGIESYDATHAATAINAGAPILTADKGFTDIPAEQLEIITHPDNIGTFRQHPSRS